MNDWIQPKSWLSLPFSIPYTLSPKLPSNFIENFWRWGGIKWEWIDKLMRKETQKDISQTQKSKSLLAHYVGHSSTKYHWKITVIPYGQTEANTDTFDEKNVREKYPLIEMMNIWLHFGKDHVIISGLRDHFSFPSSDWCCNVHMEYTVLDPSYFDLLKPLYPPNISKVLLAHGRTAINQYVTIV